MSVCDETCKPCIYSTAMSTWGICCNYILVTGNRRGCNAGVGCERRIVGEKAEAIDSIIFRGQLLLNKTIREEKKAEDRVKTNCDNCGAPLIGGRCDFCGTEYINSGNSDLTEEEKKLRKQEYNKQYYEKNREALKAKMRERSAKYRLQREKAQKTDPEPISWSERKHRTKERTKAICQGRQAEVIKKYREESGLTNAQIGVLCGVTATTIQHWANEHNLADWGKLAQLGIRKPELP